MKNPFFTRTVIPASSNVETSSIQLIRTRTLSLTVRVKCGASLDANIKVSAFYSPDGTHWDTEAFGSFEITYSAGNTVQKTRVWDAPEHGFIKFRIENQSSADSITDVKAYYTIQAHNKECVSR